MHMLLIKFLSDFVNKYAKAIEQPAEVNLAHTSINSLIHLRLRLYLRLRLRLRLHFHLRVRLRLRLCLRLRLRLHLRLY